MSKYFLGIDQGTTGVTALLCDKEFAPVSRGYCEIAQFYPQNGWVEHDPDDVLGIKLRDLAVSARNGSKFFVTKKRGNARSSLIYS